VITRPLGRTGHRSSVLAFGGAAFWQDTDDARAAAALDDALAGGVNHVDVAPMYGEAERLLGPAIARNRDRVFLACKTTERRARKAREELHRSLDRLGTDHVDLWQLHNLSDPIQWDRALSPGGAIEAAIEAREQGLVRAIGVTGHGTQVPGMHLRSLQRFAFDSVLTPYNFLTMQNGYYAENFARLEAHCRENQVALQTIKSIAYRPWMAREHTSSTWYQPLADPGDIALAIRWALARPGIFVISVGDINLLPHVLDAAERSDPAPGDTELRAMVDRLAMEPLFV